MVDHWKILAGSMVDHMRTGPMVDHMEFHRSGLGLAHQNEEAMLQQPMDLAPTKGVLAGAPCGSKVRALVLWAYRSEEPMLEIHGFHC